MQHQLPVPPSHPRHPNAFFLFLKDETPKARERGMSKRVEVVKSAKDSWRRLSSAQRKFYSDRAAQIRAKKYQLAFQKYRLDMEAFHHIYQQGWPLLFDLPLVFRADGLHRYRP